MTRLLTDLLAVLRSEPLDTIWTSFETGDDLILEVERIADGIAKGDDSARSDLALLFAPTGVLQDTAISSGFADQYMRLAERHDRLRQ